MLQPGAFTMVPPTPLTMALAAASNAAVSSSPDIPLRPAEDRANSDPYAPPLVLQEPNVGFYGWGRERISWVGGQGGQERLGFRWVILSAPYHPASSPYIRILLPRSPRFRPVSLTKMPTAPPIRFVSASAPGNPTAPILSSSPASATPSASRSRTSPTLQQFDAWHSMLCFPSTARLCTFYFTQPKSGGGTPKIIFVRENQTPYRSLGITGDYTASLTWWLYYGLVVYSFTGLSTALNLTDKLACSEDHSSGNGLDSRPPTNLTAHLSDGETKVIRHFSYNFRLPGIEVDMWHVQGDSAIHLVEVYKGGDWGMAVWAGIMAGVVVAGVAILKRRHS